MRRGLPRSVPGLDLIPILSLVVHLVPMLLLSVRFLHVTQVDARGPVVSVMDAPDEGSLSEQQSKVVSVEITIEGFWVGGDPTLDPKIPCVGACTPETYDYAGLSRAMVGLKRVHPDERRVVIAPSRDVPFEVVARAMAAARGEKGELFSEPLMAGVR